MEVDHAHNFGYTSGDFHTFNDSLFNTSQTPTDYLLSTPSRRRSVLQPHAIIALTLCVIAILANCLSLLATLRVRGGLTTHYRLVISLAISDILIAVSVMLYLLNTALNPRRRRDVTNPTLNVGADCAFVTIKALNTTALNISLLNLMGMAIDHHIAIMRPLHYHRLMSPQRGTIMIAIFWVIAVICGFSDIISGFTKYKQKYSRKYNYCDFVYQTVYQEEYTVFSIALLCLFAMFIIYINIFREVRCKRPPPAGHEARSYHNENTKAIVTTLLILVSFAVCWLPSCLFQISLLIQVSVDRQAIRPVLKAFLRADKYLYDLLLLNCILDPIIYVIRKRDVQQGYLNLFYVVCRQTFTTGTEYTGTVV